MIMLSSNLKHVLCLLLFFCNVSYALPFTISPKAGTTLPTTVTKNSTVMAYYTVVNDTAAARYGNFIKYLPPNVSQVTTGGTYANTCGATFALSPTGTAGSSCTLQLLISGAVNANDTLPAHHLFVCFPDGLACSGTNSPLNVSVVSAPPPVNKTLSTLSITPTSIFLSINGSTSAQITVTGTYTDGSTATITSGLTWNISKSGVASVSANGLATALGEGTTTISASTNGVVSNTGTVSVQSYAYVATNSGVGICSITAGGALANCNTTTLSSAPVYLALNFNTPILYQSLPTTSQNLFYSTINTNGTLGSQTLMDTLPLSIISSMVVDPQATSLYASISDFGPQEILGCTLTNGGTTVGTCASTGTGFTSPSVIGLNSTGTMAYIPNPPTISYCTANAGVLTNCNNSTAISTFGPLSIVVNPANTMLYVASTESIEAEITSCSLNANGTINACNAPQNLSVGGFEPQGLAINAAGTTLYYTNNGSGDITYCTINSDGTIGNCAVTGSVLSGAMGIVLY
jgi:hypothetical protein